MLKMPQRPARLITTITLTAQLWLLEWQYNQKPRPGWQWRRSRLVNSPTLYPTAARLEMGKDIERLKAMLRK